MHTILKNSNTNVEESICSFDDLDNYIKNHHAIKHPLFDYLEQCRLYGFNAKQYAIYRDNYLLRTFYTIPSVAALVIAAALNADMQTLSTAGQNLYEEVGHGDPSKIHSHLLVHSHNVHAKVVFNLEEVFLKNIQNSPWILAETKLFIENQRKIYNTPVYCQVLGAALAHETAATSMLSNFYHSFFEVYKEYHTEETFKVVSEYFLIHIGGLEEKHAENASISAKKNNTNQKTLSDLFIGSASFLNSQSRLWDGLHKALLSVENDMKKIPVYIL